MNITVLLADAAEPAGNSKISALGLGWSITTSPTPAMALVIFIDLEPEELGSHQLRVWLSKLGQTEPVGIKQGDQYAPVELRARFDVAGDALTDKLPPRVSIPIPIAPFLPLDVGDIYEWRVEVDGKNDATWRAPLYVRGPDSPASEDDRGVRVGMMFDA